jgi:hypothetical protein
MATTQKTSEFYWACRNGDVFTVKKMLSKLKANDIDHIESNGSTALHAASYYGHACIVRLLLQQGANTTIRNKYEKTAKEEASTDEVRSVFESTGKVEESDEDDENEDIPQSESVQIHRIPKGKDKSALATHILKAKIAAYNIHQHKISAGSNLEHLEKKYYKLCEKQERKNDLELGEKFFKKYRETGDFNQMIMLYICETPFYGMVQDDETFLAEMYKHLLRYDKYAFQGRTYGAGHFVAEDFEPYRWVLSHPNSLLEIRKLHETHKMISTAYQFMNCNPKKLQPVIFQIDIGEKCFNALDIGWLTKNPSEETVLVLSGTFFEVTQIKENDEGVTFISLKNVPANKSALSAII